jgi:hypothetical protein
VSVLVDAHLPERLAEFLSAHEIESIHTLDLPEKNATPDSETISFLTGKRLAKIKRQLKGGEKAAKRQKHKAKVRRHEAKGGGHT